MSGSFGIPPGTQWLQQGTQSRRRRREPATKKQQKQDTSAPVLTPVDDPQIGSWQWGLRAHPNGWQVVGSNPSSDEWDSYAIYQDLGQALNGLEAFRAWPGSGKAPPWP